MQKKSTINLIFGDLDENQELKLVKILDMLTLQCLFTIVFLSFLIIHSL